MKVSKLTKTVFSGAWLLAGSAFAQDSGVIRESLDAKGLKAVYVGQQRGDVKVIAHDQNIVRVEIEKKANAQLCDVVVERRDSKVVILTKSKGAASSNDLDLGDGIELDIPGDPSAVCETSVKVWAPRSLFVSLGAAHSKAELRGFKGGTKLALAYSSLNLSDIDSDFSLSAHKSSLEGDVSSRQAELSSVSSQIRLEWRKTKGGRIESSSANSSVVLVLPALAEASFDGRGVFTKIRNEFSSALPGKERFDISVSAVRGEVSIQKSRE